MPRLAVVLAPASLAFALAACGSSGPSPAESAAAVAPAARTAAASSTVATVPEGATDVPGGPTAAPSFTPATSGTATSPAPPVQIDESLATLLPATVDGIPVERSAETESAALTSQTLGADADGFAAVQVATADLTDLAVASIVHLKSSTDADRFFADWRPGFDQAVCSPAGGVSGTEVRTIAGRTVDTTLCVDGARVYHVRLEGGRVLLSVLDVGTRGFGQGLIEGLDG